MHAFSRIAQLKRDYTETKGLETILKKTFAYSLKAYNKTNQEFDSSKHSRRRVTCKCLHPKQFQRFGIQNRLL